MIFIFSQISFSQAWSLRPAFSSQPCLLAFSLLSLQVVRLPWQRLPKIRKVAEGKGDGGTDVKIEDKLDSEGRYAHAARSKSRAINPEKSPGTSNPEKPPSQDSWKDWEEEEGPIKEEKQEPIRGEEVEVGKDEEMAAAVG